MHVRLRRDQLDRGRLECVQVRWRWCRYGIRADPRETSDVLRLGGRHADLDAGSILRRAARVVVVHLELEHRAAGHLHADVLVEPHIVATRRPAVEHLAIGVHTDRVRRHALGGLAELAKEQPVMEHLTVVDDALERLDVLRPRPRCALVKAT